MFISHGSKIKALAELVSGVDLLNCRQTKGVSQFWDDFVRALGTFMKTQSHDLITSTKSFHPNRLKREIHSDHLSPKA